jgi:hypothetical protein
MIVIVIVIVRGGASAPPSTEGVSANVIHIVGVILAVHCGPC